jgi:hypothetical protein
LNSVESELLKFIRAAALSTGMEFDSLTEFVNLVEIEIGPDDPDLVKLKALLRELNINKAL